MNKETWLSGIQSYMEYVASLSEDSYDDLLKVLNARLVERGDKFGIGFSFGENTQYEDVIETPDGFTEDDLATLLEAISKLVTKLGTHE